VKFSCERCGKKYATADPPSPGKVYKLKCKACGHLIVVRASSAAAQPEGPGSAATAAGSSLEIPDLPFSHGVPDPSAPARNGASPATPDDATSQVAIEPVAPIEEEARPPKAESGYVDLFSDLTPIQGSELAPEDPLSAAARASLPEAYGRAGGAPDPLAALAQRRAGSRAPQPQSGMPKIPVIPKPPPHKAGLPIALIGGGVAVLVGILAFVLLGFGKKAAPPPRPIRAEEPVLPAPMPPPQPAPAKAPEPSAPPAEAQPPPPGPKQAQSSSEGPGAEQRRPEERRRRSRDDGQGARDAQERERRAREERDATERERRERDAADKDRKERERLAAAAAAQPESEGLTQAQIESVLRSTRKAFDGCLAGARGKEPRLDGRRVLLRLNIQPSGTVTYPTLDDVTLSGTDLGSCLKSAARLMVFPKFRGDTLHVEVPLVLR
jgi:DNA-directed RNA polymerase subunit RPC12/RpoP